MTQHPERPTGSPRVLLADDDHGITANLEPILTRAGFVMAVVHDGDTAHDTLLAGDHDAAILDVVMPGRDGRTVVRDLRRARCWTPIVLLTQVGESGERAMALEEGADDYLNKPFDPQELVARVRAVLRRSGAGRRAPPLAVATGLRARDVLLDRRSGRVLVAGREVGLTPKAVRLLEYLMTHADELLTRERLLEAVWGWENAAATRSVDHRIAELRRELGDDPGRPTLVETVAGRGYRFVAPVEAVDG